MHPMLNNPEKPLSEREEKLLAELEAVIETNMKGFVLVGMALKQIHEQRLYRIHYPTFEDYLLRVWDMARKTGYRLMEAADVHGNLKSFLEGVNNCSENENVSNWTQSDDVLHGAQNENVSHGTQTIEDILPKNERQARPLTLFSAEEQRDIWLQVLDKASATESKITANFIIQVILERQRKATNERLKKHTERSKKAPHIPPLVQSTYIALLQVVQNQNDEDWKSMGKPMMIQLLEDLLEDLKD